MSHWHALAHIWRKAPLRRQRVAVDMIVLCALIAVMVAIIGVQYRSPSTPIATPPWLYGNVNARYTLIEYADLECPYCKAYFPVLKAWIDAHPEVNWQWQHRPLTIHEPTTTREARLAECVGRTDGNEAFWRAVAWIYANTRGNGEGLPAASVFPQRSARLTACLESSDVGKAVQAQSEAASRAGIDATPTVKLVDTWSAKTIVLEGAIDGDVLLSAMDWLADSSRTTAPATSIVTPRTRIGRSSDTQ